MSLLVVGSIAYDSVETPFGSVERALGGSAMFFSASASFQTDVHMVGVIGDDYDVSDLDFLVDRGVNLDGLQRQSGETFRWKGRYGFDLNEAHTLATELNVFSDFKPELNAAQRSASHVFLANIHPQLQLDVLDQVDNPTLTAADTMNFWIQSERDTLLKVLERVDMLVINDAEARQLADEPNTIKAASKIRDMGPDIVVIKRGEYGAFLRAGDHLFVIPAYPLESVFDPTGAGDTFAGGLMGSLAKGNAAANDVTLLRQGVVIGSVLASFCVEKFSVDRMRDLSWDLVLKRFADMQRLTHIQDIKLNER